MGVVLSVAKLSPGQERYYEKSVATGLEDYYAGRGESPGTWAGTGAARLGLDGAITDGALATLMDGVDPNSGRRLRRHAKARTITVDRINAKSGDTIQITKELAPVSGFDLVFSVPKSVSILHAIGSDEMRIAVQAAHDEAWRAALTYLEDEACVVRTGKGGVGRERAPGFVAAAYQHRTSRAKDPHLHTHVIVANQAIGADGKWRALDGEAILATYRLAAGYLYQAQLRASLTRSLGVDWNRPTKGMAEIKGIPRAVLVEFSQRRRQIEEALDLVEDEDWHAAQNAALSTRERKDAIDLPALRQEWTTRAATHGFGPDEMTAVTRQVEWEPLTARGEHVLVQRLLGRRGLTERQTTFRDPDVVMVIAEGATHGEDATAIRERAAGLVTRDGVERLGDASVGRANHYSTRELLAAETRALTIVDRARNAAAPAVTRADVVRAAAQQPVRLSTEQLRMVETTATSHDQVVCVVGVAGAGKTTATRTLVSALQSRNIRVLGAAPSGAAAVKLAEETGIPATTVHRLLLDAHHENGLPNGVVVIVDEAGMTETRTLEPLLQLVAAAHGKVILIGDPAQLPSVGAGGLFTEIITRLGAVELHENRRQHDPAERAALATIRDGHGRDYIAWAARNHRVVENDDPIALRQRLLADWWRVARDNPADNVMITLRRRDVAELNSLARGLMDAAGLLGADRIHAAGREFAVGDRVVCGKNSDHLGVRNGTRGTVTGVEISTRSVTVETDSGRRVLPASYLDAGVVRRGYALTGHAVQGLTTERAFVLAGNTPLQEWGYVATSRARAVTTIYTAATASVAAAVERSAATTLGIGSI